MFQTLIVTDPKKPFLNDLRKLGVSLEGLLIT